MAEVAQGDHRRGELLLLLVDQLQRLRHLGEGPGEGVVLVVDLAREPVQTVHRGDDVTALFVQAGHRGLQLRDDVLGLDLPPVEGLVELVGDGLELLQTAIGEHHRQRREGLLGGRVHARPGQRDGVPVVQVADRPLLRRRVELQVLRTQEAGLPDLGVCVVWELDLRVERDRDDRGVVAGLDVGDPTDVDVGHAHRGVAGERGDVGHLHGDVEGVLPVALGAGQRQRVQPPPLTSATGEQYRPGQRDTGDESGRPTHPGHQAPPVNIRVDVRSSPDLTTLSSGSGRADGGCTPGGVWVPGFCQLRICSGSAVGVTGGMTVP